MLLEPAVTRNNHSDDAVPTEIIAEGSDPVGSPMGQELTSDAEVEGVEAGQWGEELEVGGDPEPPGIFGVLDTGGVDEAADEEVADPSQAEAGSPGSPFPTELDAVTLRRLIEALIFAADKPIHLQRLRQLTRVSDLGRLQQALGELAVEYQDRGIALHEVSGGYQFRTNTAFSPWVQQLIAGRPVRLSRAQLETLAIIAYRQPITRPEIDEIRGVDSSATLRLLLDRSLVRVLGKREEVGRPMLYGTTKEFLEFFSLGDLRELPTLREYSELTAESRKVVSERLGVEASASEVAAVMAAEARELTAATGPDLAVTAEEPVHGAALEGGEFVEPLPEMASEMASDLAIAADEPAGD